MFEVISFVHWLVIVSAILSLVGGYAYVRDTLRGKTKPNRVSWGMWALAPLVGTAAALGAGADPWTVVRIFLAGFIPLIVFAGSFLNKNAYWELNKFDMTCGALSLLALFVWGFASAPAVAILLAATGDGFAALPTIRKAWKNPETETGITFVLSLVGVLIILPSIVVWDIANSSFQIYLIFINIALITAVYRKKVFAYFA